MATTKTTKGYFDKVDYAAGETVLAEMVTQANSNWQTAEDKIAANETNVGLLAGSITSAVVGGQPNAYFDPFQIHKMNKVVIISGSLYLKRTVPVAVATVIGTLPAGFFPLNGVTKFSPLRVSSHQAVAVTYTINGNLQVVPYGTGDLPAMTGIDISVAYVIP